MQPEQFVCFSFDGSAGLCVLPNIWHEGMFTLAGQQPFFDKQAAVYVRVSLRLADKFNCLRQAPIPALMAAPATSVAR